MAIKKKKKKGRILKSILFLFFLVCIILLVIGYKKIHPMYVETQEQIYQIISGMDEGTFRRDGNTYVYDKDGEKIGKIGNENYKYVEIADISDYIKNGYIAQEDKNFATHHGVDLKAMARAGIAYIKNRGVITQGGSTITQQVIKNNLLTSERTFSRKFTEALMALELEKTYTKAQIMEYYCNSNYYGNGCYGVEGAARYYFGKSAKDVTLAEAAMIVGTSNRPNDYNPAESYEKATKKKESVLENMKAEGYITQAEYEQAMKENPVVVEQEDPTDRDNYMVSYAVHCATLRLMEAQGFSFQYTFDSGEEYETYEKEYSSLYSACAEEVRTGGYHIYTSFDQSIQNNLQKSVKKNLDGDLEAAAVCIDNETQMVVAMVGGKSSKDEFNRAFLSERNPGSSIKPLLDYGPALDKGIVLPSSMVVDEPINVNGYAPQNANGTYLGNMTVREALARSVNTVALRLFLQTGNEDALDYLSAMKFSSLCYADTTIASIALGGMTYGVCPIDMAKGYATLANGGKYSDNDCILTLKREDGSIVYQSRKKETQVYTEDTAYILTDMMQGVFREEYGTAHALYKEGKIYAGKTGTTNDNKDAWFCGYSTDYTTAVWVGCDTPKEVDGLTGSSYSAEIFVSFMETVTDASEDFTAPETVYYESTSGETAEIQDGYDLYALRPSGFDLVSQLNRENREAYLLKVRVKKEKEEAEKKVSDFEDYEIKSVDEAKTLDTKYAKVLSVISSIEDESEQIPYKERAAYQYSLLKDVVENEWKDAIEEEEDAARKEKQLAMAKKAAESEDLAVSALQDKKREVVTWYIDELNKRQVNGSGAQQMITDARNALADYEGYDDYEELEQELNDAIAYVESLPTPEELTSQENQVTMPDPNLYTD